MTPAVEAVPAPEIAAQKSVVDAEKARLSKIIADVQAKCEHRIVSESPWHGAGLNAMRICNHCLLEEEGSHWSGGSTWSRADYEKPKLGNVPGRIVVPVDSIWSMRVA